MACRLFGTKPLSKPMLAYGIWTFVINLSEIAPKKENNFHSVKRPLQNGGNFVADSGG